ncbi:MAG: hypothetical protein A2Y63_04045 [Candidatus Riflebacteria bacterium RBG_13_59_9]|nr:MAG: hypothetical protein A2Y63_04045 [Candidatus Riflebacteria bacterium RBG_13_59_9]
MGQHAEIQQHRKKLKQGVYLTLTHLRINLGFIFPLAMLILGHMKLPLFVTGSALVLVGAGLRLYSAGVLRKDKRLQRTGPYALCRNPLFLGTIILMLGFAFLSGSWTLVVLTLVVFWSVYMWVILLEERWLLEVFGESYGEYLRTTPRLLPTFRSLSASFTRVPYSFAQARANHELKTTVAGVVGVLLFLVKYALELWILPFSLW